MNTFFSKHATLAESKQGVKRRLIHIMNVKKNTKRIALLSFIAAALVCLAGCAAASFLDDSMKPTESMEPEGPLLLHIPNMIEFLKKTPEDVNGMLGDEAKNFKEVSERPFWLRSDVYEVENLSLEFITLHYNFTRSAFTGVYPDKNLVTYQVVENGVNADLLDSVEYTFGYNTADEAEQIWKWVGEQKKGLTEYFGRTYDLESGIFAYETVKSIPETEVLNGEIQWIFDTKGSYLHNIKVAYCCRIEITDTEIIVSLTVNADLGRSTKENELNDSSALLHVPNLIKLIRKTREDVNRMLGDEAKYFRVYNLDRDYNMVNEVSVAENLLLKHILFSYNLSEYVITDFSIDTNSIFYQAAETDTGVETLVSMFYSFEYDTIEEAEEIWDWMFEQKQSLTEYFGRDSDTESEIFGYESVDEFVSYVQETEAHNGSAGWYFDVKGSDKSNHAIAYVYTVEVHDKYISVGLRTNEGYSLNP